MTLKGFPHLRHTDKGDVFSVACGLYWHCADYHEGQGSDRYRILSTSEYRPGASERGPEPESTDSDIYDALAEGFLTPAEVEAFVAAGLADPAWEED